MTQLSTKINSALVRNFYDIVTLWT